MWLLVLLLPGLLAGQDLNQCKTPQNLLDEINTLQSALTKCVDQKLACEKRKEDCLDVRITPLNPIVLIGIGLAVGYLLGRM